MAFSIRLISANQPAEVWKEMNRIGVSPEGLELMIGKGEFLIVKVSNISAPAANILKQEMLAKGGEVALGKEMAYLRSEVGEAIIMGTRTQYRRLLDLLPATFWARRLGTGFKPFVGDPGRNSPTPDH